MTCFIYFKETRHYQKRKFFSAVLRNIQEHLKNKYFFSPEKYVFLYFVESHITSSRREIKSTDLRR